MYWFGFTPIFNRLTFFVFHPDSLDQNNIAQEVYLILMKTAFFQIGKQTVFTYIVQDSLYRINLCQSRVLYVDNNVIQVEDDKDIELLCQEFVDVTLETC